MRIVMIIDSDMMGPAQKDLFYDILMPRSCAAALELNAVDLVDNLTRQ